MSSSAEEVRNRPEAANVATQESCVSIYLWGDKGGRTLFMKITWLWAIYILCKRPAPDGLAIKALACYESIIKGKACIKILVVVVMWLELQREGDRMKGKRSRRGSCSARASPKRRRGRDASRPKRAVVSGHIWPNVEDAPEIENSQ
jgi:hypothetical protein